ncbi:TrkA-N domain protein [Cyanobacterium stanieri PCC 7202]|uniref:TrkA-N domain protein n=1 Tax=Cyanobacterium stanieri (strain ATCC 29140 / PCC 7202) TaxID=292563 RepID=K9YM85_CYASC|nr:TrkA-N domain protein [Cyanobacterium stanieri PCC 7202]
MKPFIIVCALGRTGYKIYTLLKQQGANVVGISDRPLTTQPNDKIIIGNMRSPQVLMEAGITEAHTIVLASNDDALNVAILTQARTLNPKIRIINRLYNRTLGARLDRILPDHFTMSVSALAAPIFAFAATGNKAIGHLKLLDKTWALQDEVIDENHPWLGIPLSQLWDNLDQMLIYYLPKQGEIDLVSAVMEEKNLEMGDHLIVATQTKINNKSRSVFIKWLKVVLNIGKYKQYARPVIVVTLILLALIFLATFTYVFVNWHISLVDALYFSVGMITGAGGKEEVAETAPDIIKIFTAIMMIVGAGIIGICYALINDFVLGSRLKQSWDVAQIPSKNHYIVCGLGNVGIEIVRELHRQGQDVVVIEPDHNNRFLHSVRSLGVPIIVEDGTLSDTLNTANVRKAIALLVVTSDDMLNVEIALTVKALAPNLPVTLRVQESQFAECVQDVFQFETVLSPAELATHSFAAAALGGRILGNGMTQDLLWVALATMITPNHPFCNQEIKSMATQADFVPLYVIRGNKKIHGWDLLAIHLKDNDILYLTIPANRLDELWRTDSVAPILFH